MSLRNAGFARYNKQQLMIGGKPFTVFAKMEVVELKTYTSQKHAIGAQRDHIQTMGVGSKECKIEGYTTVPYYESGLWTIEAYQRAGLPIPFISPSFSSLVYIKRFKHTTRAERYNSVIFEIDMIEYKPIAGLIGEILQRVLTPTQRGGLLKDAAIIIGIGAMGGVDRV